MRAYDSVLYALQTLFGLLCFQLDSCAHMACISDLLDGDNVVVNYLVNLLGESAMGLRWTVHCERF